MNPAERLALAARLFAAAARQDELGTSARLLCLKAAADLAPCFDEKTKAPSVLVLAGQGRTSVDLVETALGELGRLPESEFRRPLVRAAARAGRQVLREPA